MASAAVVHNASRYDDSVRTWIRGVYRVCNGRAAVCRGWTAVSLGKKIAVFLLGTLMLSAVMGANGAIAADRTALNQDYVSQQLAEAGAYEDLAEAGQEQLVGEIESATPGSVNASAVADDALTPAYVRGQAEHNLDAVYSYLQGGSDDLPLSVDPAPVERNLSAALAERGAGSASVPVGEELTLPAGARAEARDGLDPVAGYVQQVGLLTLLLPLVILLLAGVSYWVTRSVESTAKIAGSSFLLAGLFGFLMPTLLKNTTLQFAKQSFGGEDAPGITDGAFRVVEGFFGTIAAQSLVLLVVAAGLYGVAYADRTGRLDPLKARLAEAVGSDGAGSHPRSGGQD